MESLSESPQEVRSQQLRATTKWQFTDECTTRMGAKQAIQTYINVAKPFESTANLPKTKLMVTGFGV
jgi:hypothetical protein